MTSCMAVKENICAYLDNELGTDDRLMFEEHVESCPACRQELDEMREIIGLCTSLPQRELPDGFREELHAKLLAVADSQKSNVTGIEKSKRVKYIRMISSIAAGLLLIFLTGSLLKHAFFQPNMTASDARNTAMSAAEAPAEPSGGNLYAGAANGAATGSADSNAEAAESGSVPGIMSFSKSAAAPAVTEADRSVAAKDRSTAAAYASSQSLADTVSNKMSTITITADEPGSAAETIKALALENNGELKAPAVLFSESVTDDQKDRSGNAAVTESDGTGSGQPLSFMIPNDGYNKFISSINNSFGAANVQSGALVTEDLTETLNEKLKRSDEIDAQMQQLQKDSADNAGKIDEMKKEKEALDNEIEKLRLDSDFVTVTIYINGK